LFSTRRSQNSQKNLVSPLRTASDGIALENLPRSFRGRSTACHASNWVGEVARIQLDGQRYGKFGLRHCLGLSSELASVKKRLGVSLDLRLKPTVFTNILVAVSRCINIV